MNMQIWEELAPIREAFEDQKLKRLKTEEDRGEYIGDDDNGEQECIFFGGFYGKYCE